MYITWKLNPSHEIHFFSSFFIQFELVQKNQTQCLCYHDQHASSNFQCLMELYKSSFHQILIINKYQSCGLKRINYFFLYIPLCCYNIPLTSWWKIKNEKIPLLAVSSREKKNWRMNEKRFQSSHNKNLG